MIEPQFFRFLIAGGLAASVNFGSRFIFSMFFNYSYSILFSYLVGMFFGFILMKGHVFKTGGSSLAFQVIKFLAINLVAVLQTLVVSLFLARYLLPLIGIVKHADAIAHLIGVLVPVASSYWGHKFLTFR